MTLSEAVAQAVEWFKGFVKKLFRKILNVATNILPWFRQPAQMEAAAAENRIRVLLKQGDYNVVAGIFDHTTNALVGTEVLSHGYDRMNKQSAGLFGDKDLVVFT